MNVISALPILIKLARKADLHRNILGCAHKPRWHGVTGMDEHPSLDWSVCPLDLLGHPMVSAIFHLDALAKVAPLSGWPNDFAAWAVSGLMTLRQLRGD